MRQIFWARFALALAMAALTASTMAGVDNMPVAMIGAEAPEPLVQNASVDTAQASPSGRPARVFVEEIAAPPAVVPIAFALGCESKVASYPDDCEPLPVCTLSDISFGPFGVFEPNTPNRVGTPIPLEFANALLRDRMVFVSNADEDVENEFERVTRLKDRDGFGIRAEASPGCAGGVLGIGLKINEIEEYDGFRLFLDDAVVPGGTRYVEWAIDRDVCDEHRGTDPSGDPAEVTVQVTFKSDVIDGLAEREAAVPCDVLVEQYEDLMERLDVEGIETK